MVQCSKIMLLSPCARTGYPYNYIHVAVQQSARVIGKATVLDRFFNCYLMEINHADC
jgi:hypothetical protein